MSIWTDAGGEPFANVGRELEPGLYVVDGVAPKAGTELTPERLAENLRRLSISWKKAERSESLDPVRRATRRRIEDFHSGKKGCV